MIKAKKQTVVFGMFSVAAVLATVACGGSDPSGSSTQSDTKSASSSSGGSSGGSSSGGSSSGGSSSGGSSSGGSSSGGSSSGGSSSGGSSSGSTADAGVGVDAAPFECGKPGDQGNSIGVGKYCDGLLDCVSNTTATLCATLGDPGAHFCTTTCAQGDNSACGENATCQCQGGQCGCFPDACK
jgi:hypothetical protein